MRVFRDGETLLWGGGGGGGGLGNIVLQNDKHITTTGAIRNQSTIMAPLNWKFFVYFCCVFLLSFLIM